MSKKTVTKETRIAQTVRAPKRVGTPIGGFRSVPLSQAIRNWSKLLELVAPKAEKLFQPAEWNFLAAAMAGWEHLIDPEWSDPQDQLAQLAEKGATYGVGLQFLHKDKTRAADHARRIGYALKMLEYVSAWYVIYALQWRADYKTRRRLGGAEEWWTLDHRRNDLEETS